jgi:hypothetical protein
MNAAPSERKSWGPLIATIDLLFLVVAFFTLLLFFVQKERKEAQVQLERVQEQLDALPENQGVENRGNALANLVERLMTFQQEEQERQARLRAQDERRRSRPVERVEYQILPGNRIVFQGRTYSSAEFRQQVVAPLRQSRWLTFRAYAPPDTPFGEVVAARRLLLENGGEFDTYWDNLADRSALPAGR